MTILLMLAALSGPPVESTGGLTLRVHLGKDARSRIARHELECQHEFWISHRFAIARHYRLQWDDAACDQPAYRIGHGDKQPFPAGTFSASGSFIRTLRSIAEVDHWEREMPHDVWRMSLDGAWTKIGSDKPEVFPPELGGPCE